MNFLVDGLTGKWTESGRRQETGNWQARVVMTSDGELILLPSVDHSYLDKLLVTTFIYLPDCILFLPQLQIGTPRIKTIIIQENQR